MGLSLVILLVILQTFFSFPINVLHVIMAVLLVSMELFELKQQKEKEKTGLLIKVRSLGWVGSIVITGILGYWFISQGASPVIYLSMGLLVCFLFLQIRRQWFSRYILTETGLNGINDSLKISSADIDNIRMDDDQISVDTFKYRNDFELERKNLIEPEWEELKAFMRSRWKQ